ncbi:F-box domain [Cedratvirus A11]|uniref:F-box domain n=1 Tax=Cedratvirus A11 TaxID=1903266 RepID=A0A1M7XV72_9VIRU|nr:F-box domain [Cedratvirus A11]SHO33557.1 F-box domain [Cedratvirus A11]
MEGITLEDLPEEILHNIFGYVSCYKHVAGGVCRKWHRIFSEFPDKKLLLLAYAYKDNFTWLKEQWSLPDNIGGLYKKMGFSSSGMDKVVESIIEEGNPDTVAWMFENKDISCDQRTIFIKAVEKKSYRVLNWMKDKGLIDSEEYLSDLIQALQPGIRCKFYMGAVCGTKENKEMLSWYVYSKLPCNKEEVLMCFSEKSTYCLYTDPHWTLKPA